MAFKLTLALVQKHLCDSRRLHNPKTAEKAPMLSTEALGPFFNLLKDAALEPSFQYHLYFP